MNSSPQPRFSNFKLLQVSITKMWTEGKTKENCGTSAKFFSCFFSYLLEKAMSGAPYFILGTAICWRYGVDGESHERGYQKGLGNTACICRWHKLQLSNPERREWTETTISKKKMKKGSQWKEWTALHAVEHIFPQFTSGHLKILKK